MSRAYDHGSALAVGQVRIVCLDCLKDLGTRFARPDFDGQAIWGRCQACHDEYRRRQNLEPELVDVCRRCGRPGHVACGLAARPSA